MMFSASRARMRGARCSRILGSRAGQSKEAGNGTIPSIFQGGEGPTDQQRDAARLARDADDRAAFEPVRRADLRRYGGFRCHQREVPARLHAPGARDSQPRLVPGLCRKMDTVPLATARFAACWAKRLEEDGVRQIAIDGKTLRRSFPRAAGLSPLHLVGAFAPGAGLVLGQIKVDGKSNEIKALSALLELLDLRGALAAADAMHTQRAKPRR